MRVVFCGNPEFALPTLEALLASRHDVVAVVTSPDQPQGRGRKLAPMPVKSFAEQHALPVLSPAKLKDKDFLESLRELRPDALVVVAFRILPREMFSLPRWGALNVHPSLLPKFRGPAPIQWTLLRGETETGVTIIRLTEEIDGGGMLAQQRTPVQPYENFGALHNRLSIMGAGMLVEVLDKLDAGEAVEPLPQDDSLATPARKLKSEDFQLDFRQPARDIINKIRALSPSPGAVAQYGEFSVKVLDAEADGEVSPMQPGQVKHNQVAIWVGTADAPLQFKTVKPPGKREMSVADYLRGRPQLPDCFY